MPRRPRPDVRHPGALAALLVGAALLAGCGGDDDPVAQAPTTTREAPGDRGATTPGDATTPGGPSTTPSAPQLSPRARRAERRLFPDVPSLTAIPQEPTGPADAADRRVAERWFALVRAGEDAKAGDLMTDGTRFANIDVLKLENRSARVAAARSLPCGAEPVDVGGAKGGYVVLTLKLVDKEGLPPCAGAGSPVAVSLHVTDGRIDDWVRVQAPDAPINRGTPV